MRKKVYKIMPDILRKIVVTKRELSEETGVSLSAVSRVIEQLVELGILVQDIEVKKKPYRYKRIYEVFIGKRDY